MANHLSAEKATRQNIKKNAINKSRNSKIKTYIKKVLQAVESGDTVIAKNALVEAQSQIAKGAAKNIMKNNTASRKISRLAAKVKNMSDNKV